MAVALAAAAVLRVRRIDWTVKALAMVVAVSGMLVYVGAPDKTVPASCTSPGPSGPAALYQLLQTCGWPKNVDTLPPRGRGSPGESGATGIDPLNAGTSPPAATTASYGPADAVAALKEAA